MPARPNSAINQPTGGPSHRRGRRAGRRVQERRHDAIERQRRLSYHHRTLIPVALTLERNDNLVTPPGPDPVRDVPTSTSVTGDRPGGPEPVAGNGDWRSAGDRDPRRVERYPPSSSPTLGTTADRTETRCLLLPPRLSASETHQLERQMRTTNRHYIIGHLNARSLAPRLNEVCHLLHSERLDILCISETWLSEDVLDAVLIVPGYRLFRCDRPGGRRGGGVAILVSSDLRVSLHTTPVTATPAWRLSGCRLEEPAGPR